MLELMVLSLACSHYRYLYLYLWQSHSQPLHDTRNGVSDTDCPNLVIARHKHSHRISLIRSGRYKVPQGWR